MTEDGSKGLLGAGICIVGLCGGGGGALLCAWASAAIADAVLKMLKKIAGRRCLFMAFLYWRSNEDAILQLRFFVATANKNPALAKPQG